MNNLPTIFSFEGIDVRTITKEGNPWWVLSDVCKVLEIALPHRAADRLDSDEKDRHNMTTLGGSQEMTIINESGLYSLILTSRKPSAKRFKKWVTSEVLPAIRKTGGYMVATPEETPEQIMARAILVAQDTIKRQQAELDVKQDIIDREVNHITIHQYETAAGRYFTRQEKVRLGQLATKIAKELGIKITKKQMLYHGGKTGRPIDSSVNVYPRELLAKAEELMDL